MTAHHEHLIIFKAGGGKVRDLAEKVFSLLHDLCSRIALKHVFAELRRTRITERQPGRKLSQQNKRGPCIVIFSQPAQIAVEESDAGTLGIHSGTFFKYPGIS